MMMKKLRWLALAAAAALAACGGANESTQTTPAKNAFVLQGSNLVASSDQEVSFNKADAVTQTDIAEKHSARQEAFTEVVIDSKSMRQAGANLDLGTPPVSELEKMATNNLKRTIQIKPRAYQIGFARPVTAASTAKKLSDLLVWNTTDSGVQRASIRLSSTGAQGIRIGLLVETLPDDAVIRVYADSSLKAQQTSGAFINTSIRRNIATDGDSTNARTYWLPSTMGEAIVLEIDLPAGRDTSLISVSVPKLMHQAYTAIQAALGQIQAKSSCPNKTPDATCTLPPATNAVTSMDFVDGGSFMCTGTLIANRGATQQGYILTADHCIHNQTAASSITSYWFWRSSACNSTTINPNWRSVSGGATLRYHKTELSQYALRNNDVIVTSDGTDTSLIDMNNAPPAGAMYAGWAFQRLGINTGTNYVALHHPASPDGTPLLEAEFMRRSDGQLTSYGMMYDYDAVTGNPLVDIYNDNRYPMYQVTWTSGITEPGSSGSALFQDGATSNPKVIGQLWGGNSSCSNPTGKDYYGRFDLAYENGLINWLNPGYRMVFRFYNAGIGAHFFSASPDERDAARTNNESLGYEGPVFMVSPTPGAGLNPVYRFYNRLLGVHFYTDSETEKANVSANLSHIYSYEGIAWYAPPASATTAGLVNVYRFYRLGVGTHLYTTSVDEKNNIQNNLSQFYAYEGVAYKAWSLN